ncbi:lysine N(6)-hydroxylase/L-ornithine N(5)-oxygenase family protein [Bacillus tianshenii]|nr:lysine N(6)-hydroxylase/L-ornithine N(5)-oxygenase family protein [Bacillus tianshenii]
MKHLNIVDVIGVGVGPFNLGLAALTEDIEEVDALFFEQKTEFNWHPGLLIEGTTLQVPFFADLVTMADPTNRFSYLNYLHEHGRLYKFYFLERFHIPRREYNDYCRWVTEKLSSCQFGMQVTSIQWKKDGEGGYYEVEVKDVDNADINYYYARHLVLGVGTSPSLPSCFEKHASENVFHSAEFLYRREQCRQADSITVIGSGQSAAEVFLELLHERPTYGYELNWFTRSDGFFPMEYSKLGLEHFSPDYTNYFYQLPQAKKDELLPKQGLLYKGISAETIADIYDVLYEQSVGNVEMPVHLQAKTEVTDIEASEGRCHLHCTQYEQGSEFIHESEVVVAATGYEQRLPQFLSELSSHIQYDEQNRYIVKQNYTIELTKVTGNHIFVQNADMHTHGVGAPDLGLGAHRNATIIRALTGRDIYPIREQNVFQHFGAKGAVRNETYS